MTNRTITSNNSVSNVKVPRIDGNTKVILRQPVQCSCGLELRFLLLKNILVNPHDGSHVLDGNVWFNCDCNTTKITSIKNISNLEVLL